MNCNWSSCRVGVNCTMDWHSTNITTYILHCLQIKSLKNLWNWQNLGNVKTSCILTKCYTWCIIPSLIYFVSSLRWFPYSDENFPQTQQYPMSSPTIYLNLLCLSCIFKIMHVWRECIEVMLRKISHYYKDMRENKCHKLMPSMQ